MVISWLSRIASLPERLRNTFRLHFYQQRTHTEIAEEQGITYDNVCKRISTEDINSTGAIADNTTPEVTSVSTSSAPGITAPEKAVVKKAIDHDCGSEKSVGICDSNGLVQNYCGEILVSWLSTIGSLSVRLRNSFRLHFYQQRSHAEIAEEQGITYDNVCKRISLARKEIKEVMWKTLDVFSEICESRRLIVVGKKVVTET
ncbi:MAG: sigma-70 family RNA polymerase sigma factor [Symploca sp. SIO2E9]|nr:sigma-70 family RNA polymerase sigma factor [Symploca sp. SIO2E9]